MSTKEIIQTSAEVSWAHRREHGEDGPMEEEIYVWGYTEGYKAFPLPGQVIQVSSDTWYQYNRGAWSEMAVEEQLEWSRIN